jgi:Na+/proline symporter
VSRAERQRRARRNARLIGLAGFLGAAALPVVLWHRAIALIAADFHLEARYLVGGWLGYSLIAFGLLLCVPVLLSIGRDPESRLYPRARNAYLGWGVSCYLLGLALAVQVAAIAQGVAEH